MFGLAGTGGMGDPSWLFPANFEPILGYFGLFRSKSWLSPADTSSRRHLLFTYASANTLLSPLKTRRDRPY